MQEFKLPDLGEGMHEAEIRRWLVKPGDIVKLDQPMVEVETDKAVVEIPAPVAARVSDIRVQEGAMAKLGEVLVVFEAAEKESAPKASANIGAGSVASSSTSTTAASTSESSSPVTTTTSAARSRVLAAPAVRKRAFELGINLASVTPSHPSGRVTLEDVEAYVAKAELAQNMPTTASSTVQPTVSVTTPSTAAPTAHEPVLAATNGTASTAPFERQDVTKTPGSVGDERQPLTGLRRRIAERMERSWRTIPHATAFDELDGTELVALRTALKPVAEQRGIRLTYMPLLIKLLLPLLKEFPIFNASLDEERREIIYKRAYHIGIATDSPEGLFVTVLRDADKLTLMQLAQQLERLSVGAQKRTLSLQEVSGSTFTLNNVGSFGGSSGTPIINYPEVAILAVGRLQEKAIVRTGKVLVRTMMPLAMSFDHRLIDGALSGRFLGRFKELVEHPQQLMLDMV